jgi:hypothetical protein
MQATRSGPGLPGFVASHRRRPTETRTVARRREFPMEGEEGRTTTFIEPSRPSGCALGRRRDGGGGWRRGDDSGS